jgi:hypothetical protein
VATSTNALVTQWGTVFGDNVDGDARLTRFDGVLGARSPASRLAKGRTRIASEF